MALVFFLLQLHGKPITWDQLTHLYHSTVLTNSTGGFVKLYKLTDDHINLTSYTKMRVSLAVQVGSQIECG